MKTARTAILVLLCVIALAIRSVCASQDDTVEVSKPAGQHIRVLHSVSGSPFAERGVLNFNPNSKKKSALKYVHADDAEMASVLKPVTSAEDYYTVRFVSSSKPDSHLGEVRVRACQLHAAGLREHFVIHVDQDGEPFRIDYLVPSQDCSLDGVKKAQDFKPTIELAKKLDGPRPHLIKVKEVAMKDGKPVQEEEKSFWQKYWMYIVPIVLLVLLNGGGDSQEGGSGAAAASK
ncbi:uncharacterized protein BJ171DRAFT_500613 [Polychytrium aggregatum]|uniref:uncharacterized protein n=1 Tax=Polychytrium aggregatum TaxID=110093 RepID=UPI0022FEB6C8|nr:uncharacterized protein BJ171DRAFT_500613 [Polychytrium aggregatum]KAI9205489.1 hypothetical protein BJ171DRAFT_500613 [Polychytrium aggregatum]